MAFDVPNRTAGTLKPAYTGRAYVDTQQSEPSPAERQMSRKSVIGSDARVLCPRCQHDVGHVTFTCHTTLGATCARCGHEWAAALADMPEPLRVAVQTEILHRDHRGQARH